MKENLPVIYLSFLIFLLAVTVILVLRQIIKTRRVEGTFNRLQKKLKQEKGTTQEYYELGSLYLDKKLFVQAANLLQKAIKLANEDDTASENKALIYNALGYAYFAQEQYDLAIRQYKDALKLYPEYIVALNNLANLYEKKQMVAKAIETYDQAIKCDPDNSIAKKRAEALRKRLVTS